MEVRQLGRSGLRVSVLALGTMTFGAEADEPTSHALLDHFAESGGTLIDTADVYGSGTSEEIIGRWLARRQDRERFVLATKGRFAVGSGVHDSGSSRIHLQRAVEASLGRLGVESIDLYQLHGWDPATPIEETLRALDDLVTAGKVKYIGVSNFTGYQLMKTLAISRYERLSQVVSVQPQYSLVDRTIELDVLPVCLEEHVGVLPWSPLGGGWLTGKYAREIRPSGETRLGEDPARGVEAYDLRGTEATWRILAAVREIAAELGVEMAQVAIAWTMGRPAVSSVILGARSVDQLQSNLGSVGVDLPDGVRRRLDAISAPGIPLYPHGFLERYCDYRMWERLGTRAEPPPIGR